MQMYTDIGFASNRCLNFFRAQQPTSEFYYHPDRSESLEVEKFWKKLQQRNNHVQKNIQSASTFSYVLKHIFKLIETDHQFNLQTQLKQLSNRKNDRYTFAYLLYLLSYSKHGRQLIKDNFILINGSDFWNDRMHLRFSTAKMSNLGELDYLIANDVPSLRLNEDMRVGIAILIFAHELVHLYNAGTFGIHHEIKNDQVASAMDEVLAHYFQTLIGRDFLQHPAFKKYRSHYKNVSIQRFYTFSRTSIQKHLTSERYKFKPKVVDPIIERVHWPEAP